MSGVDRSQIRISKLDAARRQLDCAIELWFAERDPVAVHSLAAAAHQVVHDINAGRGGPELLFDSPRIRSEKRAELVGLLKQAMNFFKHADRDPHGVIEFTQVSTVLFLVVALQGLQHLGERFSDVELVFLQWLTIHEPDWLSEAITAGAYQRIPVDGLEQLRRLDKREFFEIALQAYAQARARGLI
jgi:hypothetical protein